MTMQRILTFLAVSVAVASAAPVVRAAGSQPDNLSSQTIYGGEALTPSGAIRLNAWGGGDAVDNTGGAFTRAGHAIRIETGGLYQGGQIIFANGLPLGDVKADKSRFLQLVLSVGPSQKFAASSAAPPASGAQPGASFHIHWDAAKWVRVAQMTPPAGGSLPPDDTSGMAALPIQSLHVVLEFASGAQVEMMRPVRPGSGDINWLRTAIPISAIPLTGADASNATLKKIFIGSDSPASLMIGEIRIVTNVTPISAYAGEAQTVPTNSDVTFVGVGDGGASALKFEWDFDQPASFAAQAQGARVVHHFGKAGDYTVTLRVSDYDGIKNPATSTVVVHVTDQ